MSSLPAPESIPFKSAVLAPLGTSTVPANGAAAPAVPQPSISFRFVLHVLRRWWHLAIPAGAVLAIAAAAAGWWLLEPDYRAIAWVQIKDNRPAIVFEDLNDSRLFVRTQIELIKSPLVIGRLLQQPEIAQLQELKGERWPVEWLSARTSVKSVGNSELFQIIFDASNPQTAALVVNGILDNYLRVQSERMDLQSNKVLTVLKEAKKDREADLVRLRGRLQELTKHSSQQALDIGKVVVSSQNPFSELQAKLAEAEVEREVLEARLTVARQSNRQRSKSSVEAQQKVAEDPAVQRLQTTIADLRLRLKEAQAAVAPGVRTAAVDTLTQRLANSEEMLSELRRDLSHSHNQRHNELRQKQHDEAIDELSARIAEKKLFEKVLQEKLASQKQEAETAGDQSLQIAFARAELDRGEAVYQRISDRTLVLQTERQAPERVTPLEWANPKDVPMLGNPLKKMALLALGVFFLPLAVAVGWEHAVHRVSHSQQLSRETLLPVIGEITSLPTRVVLNGSRGAVRYRQLRSVFEESIDQLRNRLTLPDDLQQLQVIAVASAASGEGKTSLASQLAVSLARTCRQPVLLIDGDMRAPDIHDIFGVALSPGLAELLADETNLADATHTGWSDYVHIIPAGRLEQNPHILMTSQSLGKLVDKLRGIYRYIIIDAPPLLAASEGLVAARAADGVIVCTMRDVTRTPQLKIACERLLSAGARPLGIVLSGIPCKDYLSYYGSYGAQSQTDASAA